MSRGRDHRPRPKPLRRLESNKKRNQAIANGKAQAAFYHAIVSPFEQKNPGLLYPFGMTNTCQPPSDPSRCHLLELPAELRVHIYSYILAKPERIYLKKRNYSTFAQPNILRVSSQIRHEALPVYYGVNAFTVRFYTRHFVELAHWLKRVVKVCGANPFKQHVDFEIQCGGFKCAFKSFTFMNLLREGKLVLNEEQTRLFRYPGGHGSDTLPGALDEMVKGAAELGRKGESCRRLADSMEAVFERHVRAGEPRKRYVRLAQIWKWGANLRAKIEARTKKEES